ncbi:hypothetical protein ABVK25_007829 [Lepraria finkii]|uniref:DUF7141 domain-containing protein n=1 Tax=Lepraria finkii TaxID=1340010 RepID=A0ABR4B1Y3_9LECA
MAEVDAMDVQIDGIGKSQDQEIEIDFADEGFIPDVNLIEPTTTTTETPNPTKDAEQSFSPLFVSQENISEHPLLARGEALRPEAVKKRDLAVVVPPIQHPWEYLVYEEPEIKEIVEAYDNGEYLVQFEDEREEVMTHDQIMRLYNGATLLVELKYQPSGSDSWGSDPGTSDVELTYLDSTKVAHRQNRPDRPRRNLTGPRTSVNGRRSRLRNSRSQLSLASMISDSDEEFGRSKTTSSGSRPSLP